MTHMNGFEISKKMRDIYKNQVIAITTTKDDSKYFLDAISINVDSFIIKPIKSIDDIKDILINLAQKSIQNNKNDTKEFLLDQRHKIIDENVLLTSSDLAGRIKDISQAYLDFTGYTKEEVIDKNHSIFRNHDIDKSVIINLWETISNDKIWEGEIKNNKKSGEAYWIKTVISPLYNVKGKKIGYNSVKEDITNQKRLEELSLKDSLTQLYNRRHFDTYLKKELKRISFKKEHIALLLIELDYFEEYKNTYGHVDADSVLIKISDTFKKYMDTKISNVFRISESEFAIIMVNKDHTYVENFSNELLKTIELLELKNDQSQISTYFTASIGVININSKICHVDNDNIYNIADANLTQAKLNGGNSVHINFDKEHIENLKNIDKITKLPTRAALLHDVSLIQEESMLIVLHINKLNSLKNIYGFSFISDLVRKKASQLKSVVKREEATLYNLNLQEFAILVTDKNLFDKYFLLLKHSILLPNDDNDNTVCSLIVADYSAGIAYGISNIFNNADIALQGAITSKQNYKVYENNQSVKQLQKDNMNRLKVYKNALHEDRIIPYFQPIVDTYDASVIKYEALARLITENGEIISPYYFLSSAKEDKTFEFFTRQMMQKVFNVYAKNEISISINLTYDNISSDSMLGYIENRLNKYGGTGITFEIVESEDILDYKIIKKFISMVKEYGCKISIDDFGVGYSNFTNITQLDIDYIKLDGSLIQKLNSDENIKHMIKGLLVYAKNAKIKTIAEFVSTKELVDSVQELGIDYIQGYYYGEPKTAQEYGLKG